MLWCLLNNNYAFTRSTALLIMKCSALVMSSGVARREAGAMSQTPNKWDFYVSIIQKIPNLLPSDVVLQAENAPKPFSVRPPPRTPMGELTTLPQTPSWLGRGNPLSIPLTLRLDPAPWFLPTQRKNRSRAAATRRTDVALRVLRVG